MKRIADHADWLSYAEADLELAVKGKVSKKVKYELLCFHAQQTVEKSMKAVLIFLNIQFPKTHELDFLLELMLTNKIDVPKIVFEAVTLSRYAVISRYPGDEDEIERKEYIQCIKLATVVFKWAKSITAKKSNKLF